MDAQTGKLLNNRQLRRDQQYKKQWDKSAGNEFGQLANEIGRQVKGTKIIKIHNKVHFDDFFTKLRVQLWVEEGWQSLG